MTAVAPGRSARSLPLLVQVDEVRAGRSPGRGSMHSTGLRTDLRASTDPLVRAPAYRRGQGPIASPAAGTGGKLPSALRFSVLVPPRSATARGPGHCGDLRDRRPDR
jgi:hypothetical protein